MIHGPMMTQGDPLLKAVRAAVADAMTRDFPLDVLLGPDMSRMVSVCNSVVKRHGLLLEQALADALEASGRFEVLRGSYVTITPAADSVVASNAPSNLSRIALRQDGSPGRLLQWDLIVIDAEAGWAGAYSVKRGNGTMGHRMRLPLAHDVAAVRLLLRSHVRDLGHANVDCVTSACIDWFGAAKMPPHLTVLGSEVDEHFGVPVSATVDRMTSHLRTELLGAIPALLRPVVDVLAPSYAPEVPPRGPGPRPDARSHAERQDRGTSAGAEAEVVGATGRPVARGPRGGPPEVEILARPAGPDRVPLRSVAASPQAAQAGPPRPPAPGEAGVPRPRAGADRPSIPWGRVG